MFKRKHKISFSERLKSWFWPSIGWKKYWRYLLLRLSRLGTSPSSVASGVACGVAVSFTPFVGLHFVLAAITAFLCRGNILASALGTAVGNPWTFPFIWMGIYYTGRWFLGDSSAVAVSFMSVFEKGMHALISFDFSGFATDVWPVIKPMMIGCIPYYIVAWAISYYIVNQALSSLQKSRHKGNRI